MSLIGQIKNSELIVNEAASSIFLIIFMVLEDSVIENRLFDRTFAVNTIVHAFIKFQQTPPEHLRKTQMEFKRAHINEGKFIMTINVYE